MRRIVRRWISATAINPDSAWWPFLFPRKAQGQNRRAKLHIANQWAEIVALRDVLSNRDLQIKRVRDEKQAVEAAYHRLVNPNESFYSWQRDWQDTARIVLKLPEDASVIDINAALLLRNQNTKEVEE